MSRKTGRSEFMEAAGVAVTGMVTASQPITGNASQPQQQPAPAAGTMGARFRRLIQRSDPFESIAVFDVMTARMTEVLGFPSLSIGGSAVDEFQGVPGYGLTAGAYKIDFGRRIANSVDIPVMIDIADDAFTPLILYRDVGEFQRAGLGAIHLVDGRSTGGGGFFSQSEMVDRIHAAADGRSDMV